MTDQSQYRYCRCGTRLGCYNASDLCSACQGKARDNQIEAPNVPPDFWLTERFRKAFTRRHMGEVILAYRTHPFHPRPISQATVARWAGISQAQLSRIESGSPSQNLKQLMHWAYILRIPDRLLWFKPEPSNSKPGDADTQDTSSAASREVSTTLRREFFGLSGIVAASNVAGILENELDRIHITLDRGTASDERIVFLEGVANDLGVQAVRAAPMAILKPTLAALRSIRALLEERQPTRYQVRLVAASARLSTVVGEVMFNLGQFERAREWYKAAQHAAHDAGDQYLWDISLAGQAYLPTYSDEPVEVLRLLEPRLNGKPSASPAIAWLWGFRARAHGALGEADEFKRSIDNAREVLARSGSDELVPGIFSFLPEKLAFYETTGAVRLNNLNNALEASRRALALYDPSETTEPALVKLDRATALAQAGELAEACEVAKEAVLDPNTYYGITVRTYVIRFSEHIRTVQSSPAREWRELVAQIDREKRAGVNRADKEV